MVHIGWVRSLAAEAPPSAASQRRVVSQLSQTNGGSVAPSTNRPKVEWGLIQKGLRPSAQAGSLCHWDRRRFGTEAPTNEPLRSTQRIDVDAGER